MLQEMSEWQGLFETFLFRCLLHWDIDGYLVTMQRLSSAHIAYLFEHRASRSMYILAFMVSCQCRSDV